MADTFENKQDEIAKDEKFNNDDWESFRDWKEQSPKWLPVVKKWQFWIDEEDPDDILLWLDFDKSIQTDPDDLSSILDEDEIVLPEDSIQKKQEEKYNINKKGDEIWWIDDLWEGFDPLTSNNEDAHEISTGTPIETNSSIKLESENKNRIEENPKTPLIDSLERSWIFTIEESVLVKEALMHWGNFKKQIGDIEGFNKKDETIKLLEYLDKPETQEINQKVFNDEYSEEIDIIINSNLENDKWEKTLTNKQNELISKLGANYFPIWMPWKIWETKWEWLDKAFKMTLNEIIEGKQFPKNDAYDLAVIDIKVWNFEEKFKALQYISSIVETSQSLHWAKTKKSFDKIKWEHKNKKSAYLDFKIEQLDKQISESKNNSEKIKLNNQLEEFEKMKKEDDFTWEIFNSSEYDKLSDNLESWKEQA